MMILVKLSLIQSLLGSPQGVRLSIKLVMSQSKYIFEQIKVAWTNLTENQKTNRQGLNNFYSHPRDIHLMFYLFFFFFVLLLFLFFNLIAGF